MANSNQKTVLVSGGAGYIGSMTSKLLSQNGFKVVVFDNFSTGHRQLVKWGEVIEGDLRNPDDIRNAIKTVRPIGVIHFAAKALVEESVRNPQLYFENNVQGTENLIKAMIEFDCQSIVFSSTCAVYGEPKRIPITEDLPKNPINPYGESKLRCEGLLEKYRLSNGLRTMALRYFNACGADPESETGEHHEIETHVIPILIEGLLAKSLNGGGAKPFQIRGTDYPTRDGTCIRDYIHILDLAHAHLKALQLLLSLKEQGEMNTIPLAMNLGTGVGFSVREMVHALEKTTKLKVDAIETDRRPGDPPELVANATLAKKVMDWQPQYSDLSGIFTDAFNWHKKKRKIFN